MQARYLGDSHDYLKYALLRSLAEAGFGRLAVAWYLTDPIAVDPQSSTDGEKRHHLSSAKFGRIDPPLLDALRQFSQPRARDIRAMESSGILGENTIFTGYHPPCEPNARKEWWSSVLEDCSYADVVFCDPDNGFMVPSATRKTRPKYAEFAEVSELYRRGKTVVCIQFARQCNPIARGESIRRELAIDHPECGALPILRGRVAPNILFHFLAPPPRHDLIAHTLEKLIERAPGVLEVIL